MKKPILLLVDDDASVLEALTAELTPAFGEICRIEAFTEPGEVLAAMSDWAAEGRPMAMAIVDQRMPGISGTDLLVAIRTWKDGLQGRKDAFHPAMHVKAVLLTGHAGLDSAVVAKNACSLDRYLEKPWTSIELADAARTLLSAWIAESGAHSYVGFREIAARDELQDFLSLRFAVFELTPGGRNLIPTSGGGGRISTSMNTIRSRASSGCSRSTRRATRLWPARSVSLATNQAPAREN